MVIFARFALAWKLICMQASSTLGVEDCKE